MKKKTSTMLALSLSLGLLTTNNLEVLASELDEGSEQSIVNETNSGEELEEVGTVEDEEKPEEVTEEVADEEADEEEEVAEEVTDGEEPQESESEEEAEEEQKDGWIEEDGGIFYYENGKKATGWKEISNNWYYF